MTVTFIPDVTTGEEAVARLRQLAGYVDRRSVAFCTSSTWLAAAARHLPARPVLVTVRSADEPVALAVLGVTRRRGVRRVQLLGGDLNDYGQFYYDGPEAAEELAAAIAAWLAGQRPWSLALGQLPDDDPVLAALERRLPGSSIVVGQPMPRITGIGTDYAISRNRRQKGTQAVRRIEADGRSWERVVVDDPETLERWLPAVVELRRQRDHASGRRSHLDDDRVLAFYEDVVRSFVGLGRARVYLLVIDGRVAGYSLVILDGDTHRLYDGRVNEELRRYRGGMVCDLQAVTHAAEDPAVTTFDWHRGQSDAKFGNDEIHRVELRGSSHRAVLAVDEWERAARGRIKAALPAAAVRRLAAR